MTVKQVHLIIKRDGPISTADIAEQLGVTVSTVTRQIKTLRGRCCVYISDYLSQPGGHGRRIPLYCVGDNEDMEQPVYKQKPKPSRAKSAIQARAVAQSPRPFVSGIWGGLMR